MMRVIIVILSAVATVRAQIIPVNTRIRSPNFPPRGLGDDSSSTTPVASTPTPAASPDTSSSTEASSDSPTPTPASPDSQSSSSTSSFASLNSTNTSSSRTSRSSSTSLSPSSTSSGPPTGASVSSLGVSSASPNNGDIVAAVVGGLVALALLLLAIYLYYRRKRLNKTSRQFHLLETKPEGLSRVAKPFFYSKKTGRLFPVAKPYFNSNPNPPSTSLIITSYPPTHSSKSSAVMSKKLASDPRMASGSSTPITPSVDDTSVSSPPDDFPPVYRDEDEESQRIQAEEAERTRSYDELIAGFCASHRDLITPDLERKLHAARYLPEDNPSDVPAEYWHRTYGVEYFELKRLRTAYERNVATQALINMPEKASPQVALTAKEKAMHPHRQARGL